MEGVPAGSNAASTMAMDQMSSLSDATTDWLFFFLMTIVELALPSRLRTIELVADLIDCKLGWFILLTSVLGFWRVKRWEANIIASQRENAAASSSVPGGGPQQQSQAIASSLQCMFGLPRRSEFSSMLRSGLGFSSSRREQEHLPPDLEIDLEEGRDEVDEERERETLERERQEMSAMYAHDLERQRQLIQSFRDDDQLLANMRAAGML